MNDFEKKRIRLLEQLDLLDGKRLEIAATYFWIFDVACQKTGVPRHRKSTDESLRAQVRNKAEAMRINVTLG